LSFNRCIVNECCDPIAIVALGNSLPSTRSKYVPRLFLNHYAFTRDPPNNTSVSNTSNRSLNDTLGVEPFTR
jgi:hypothetical protein